MIRSYFKIPELDYVDTSELATKFLSKGKVVEASWSEDYISLLVQIDDYYLDVTLTAYGDCCSNSWIESINDFDLLVGSTINRINDECYDSDNDDYNRILYIKYTFVTDKGYVDVEFRNESNGYYSGHLALSACAFRAEYDDDL